MDEKLLLKAIGLRTEINLKKAELKDIYNIRDIIKSASKGVLMTLHAIPKNENERQKYYNLIVEPAIAVEVLNRHGGDIARKVSQLEAELEAL